MKKLVVLTGAGMSAESGLKTFRDSGGLWEGYNVMEVASPQGWHDDPEMVLNFYNERRKQALEAGPNQGHRAIAELEQHFKVTIITQNIDNLHEKAGSTDVIHLHGELFKSRSTVDDKLIYDIEGWELKMGDVCEKGYQLRPHVVWFGELVPMMDKAVEQTMQADIFMVVGTSLQVYPAAGLLEYVSEKVPVYIIDPNLPPVMPRPNMHLIEERASTGVLKAKQFILDSDNI